MRLRNIELAALACVGAAAAYLVYAFDPSTARFFPHCIFHELTGLQCPGCGGTRAMHALLHGDVVAALRFNALLVIGGPLFGVGAASDRLRRPWAGWTVAIALIAWGVLRNVI